MTEIKNSDAAGLKRAALAIIALLALVLLPSGCQKAGDGVGLSTTGALLTLCEQYPDDPTCKPPVDSCITNPSLPGCVTDTCQANPSAPDCICKLNPSDPICPKPKVKFAQVMAFFKANACQECHTGTGAGVTTGKLLLSDEAAYGNLVNATPSVPAAAKGWMRVKPLIPDSSVLYLKISKNPPKATGMTAAYGASMPYQLPLLDTSITNVVKQWILDGAEQ